jgi:hypothetical protein
LGVYADLLAAGVADDTAREIADAVHRTTGVVTVDVLDVRIATLDARIAKMEAALTRLILTTMVAMTGIFALFVSVMTWVRQ